MSYLLPAMTALAYCVSALVVRRCTSALNARSAATVFAAAISAASITGSGVAVGIRLPIDLVPTEAPYASAAIAIVALLAASLAPLASHSPRTFSRIFFLTAAAQACLATTDPLWIAVFWCASAWIAWAELSAATGAGISTRLFGLFHAVAGALFVLGAGLLSIGDSPTGAGLLLAGIAIRAAVFPGHSWFVPLLEEAPMGIAVAFAAPQLAAFAWVAASADQLPGAIANTVAGAAAFSALFAALLGLAQSNGRRAMGFLVMSQTNLVLTGIGSQSAIARSGAVFTWQSLCVAFAGFAMALAAIEARRGGLLLVAGRGNHAATPRLAAAVLIFGLACVGMPLTPGFTGEDLLLQGALSQGLQAAAIVATALNGITVLRIFLTVFSGRAPGTGEIDLRPSEVYVVGAVLAAMLAATALPRGLIAPASLRRAAIEPTGPSSGMISGNAEGKAKPHRSILPLVR